METRFNFIGSIRLPKEDSTRPFVKESSFTRKKNGSEETVPTLSLNFGVKEDEANIAFVSLFASKDKREIMTANKDGEKISVAWEDRMNKDVIDMIAPYRLLTVDLSDPVQKSELRNAIYADNYEGTKEKYGVASKEAAETMLKALGEERKQFLTSYDFIEYVREVLPTYQGKVEVTGRMKKRFYNGKYATDFEVTGIYARAESDKNKLSLTMDFFYNKDCVDKTELEDKKRVYITGYVSQYMNSTEKNKFIPQKVIFDFSKYNMENPIHKSRYDYRMSYVDIDSTEYVHMNWDVRYINGADTVAFSEDMLTPAQKQQIELGIKELKDFKPRGNIYGERIEEYRLVDPRLMGEFENGLVSTELMPEEFEEKIYVPNATVNLEEVVAKAEKTETKKSDFDDLDVDDLF